MSTSKYVIIGAGLAGAATAWHLAAQGHEVTVLERTVPANRWGSSHGSARIFRYAYPDAFYTHLVSEAKKGWEELELRSATSLLTPSGALDFGLRHDTAGLARILAHEGVPHELLPESEAHERWPQFSFDSEVLWHAGAAVIDAESAVRAMVDLAVDYGAELHSDWEVTAVTRQGSGYRISSATGESVHADHIVVAAGAYLPDLLSALPLSAAFRGRMPQFSIMQEQAFHFAYRDEFADPTPHEHYAWPAFIHQTDWIHTYGLPGGRDADFNGQKIAQFNGGKLLRSAVDQDGVVNDANRALMVEYVRKHLPGLVPEPYAETTCLFTNTPTEDFFMDSEDNITVLSPCSGHGAKFAPEIGRMTTEFITGAAALDSHFRLVS